MFDVTNINEVLPRVACNTAQLCESPVKLSEKSVFKENLDRQGRSECIGAARHKKMGGDNFFH